MTKKKWGQESQRYSIREWSWVGAAKTGTICI